MCAQNFELKLTSKDSIFNVELATFDLNKKFISKNKALKSCDSISTLLTLKGYFDNYYKSSVKDSTIIADFYFTRKFDSIKIHYKNEPLVNKLLNTLSIKYFDSIFKIPTYKTELVLNQLISTYEKEGFTFTTIKLDDFEIIENEIYANLNINIENKRSINNIVTYGYDEFPIKKLRKFLNIQNNSSFNIASLKSFKKRIDESKYFNAIKDPEVLFSKDSTQVYIYLKKKSNSKFDGLISFSNENEDKLQLNGYLNLQLSNVFNRAEEISLNWIGNTQQKTLNINYNTPYIFNTNFNFKSEFELIRKDSTYVNSTTEINLGYHLKNNVIISSVINIEKSNITNENNNPLINNYSKTLYGASFTYQLFENNHLQNTKLSFESKAIVGKRKDLSNNDQQLYSLNFNYLQKLNKKNFLYFKSDNAYLVTDTTFENEQFQIGGFNSLRGFDEESILTTKYSTNSIEYQHLTNNNSYLYSFIDIGFIDNEIENSTSNLFGLGLGYNFTTKSSIFNIGYALGKYENIPIKFKTSKILIKISYLF